jgi:hypothetical protein
MGCNDIFCPICGLPTEFTNLIIMLMSNENELLEYLQQNNYKKIQYSDLPNFHKKSKWLNKYSFLTTTNNIIKNCNPYDTCLNEFICKNKTYNVSLTKLKNSYNNFGYFIHNDCYNYVKKYHKIDLRLGDFYLNINSYNSITKHYIKCDVSKYWAQEFDVLAMINDNNFWMAESPLKNKKNAKRIDNIIRQLKIKSGRIGPTISASFYKNGTIKIGNDGYFWEIKNGKWIKISNKPIEEVVDFNDKLFLKIPTVAFTNTKPIFIKDFDNNKITIIKITKMSSN